MAKKCDWDAPLPWPERVRMLSVHPDAATRDDIARMATELSDFLEDSDKEPQ